MTLPVQDLLPDMLFSADDRFHQLYPLPMQQLAAKHWTPLHVAQKAANFLAAGSSVRILDIGSGVGKFCLSAAYYQPQAIYTGIEQRKELVTYAETARDVLHFEQVSFIHGNFTRLDLKQYDHFYFYNAFYENLVDTDKIDDSIEYSVQLYHYYNRFLYRQLEQLPSGTKLATYHSLEDEVPPSFHVVDVQINSLLKFWVKI